MKTLSLSKGSPDPLPELAAYLEPFAPLFRRRTSRSSLERYIAGLLTDLPRKNCEAIAQAVANTSLEQLQHLLTDAAWDPLALDEQRVCPNKETPRWVCSINTRARWVSKGTANLWSGRGHHAES